MSRNENDPVLRVEDLRVEYDGAIAVRGVSLEAKRGTIVGLLGANGAGKSSTLGAIAGLVAPAGGTVALDGEVVSGQPPEDVVRKGISLVPEGRRIFDNLSVEENLRVGATPRGGDTFADDLAEVYGRFPTLEKFRRKAAGNLSGGEQQQLAIGRALICRPTVLLLDEPSLGLAPKIVAQVFDTVAQLREAGVTILLAEQFVAKTLAIADHVYVLNHGVVGASGTPSEIAEGGVLESQYLTGGVA